MLHFRGRQNTNEKAIFNNKLTPNSVICNMLLKTFKNHENVEF